MRISLYTLIFFAGWAVGHQRYFLALLLLIAGGCAVFMEDSSLKQLHHYAGIVAIISLFVVMIFCLGCKSTNEVKKDNDWRDRERTLQESMSIAKSLTYVRDPRTDQCFAVSNTYMRTFATVDCTPKVMQMVNATEHNQMVIIEEGQ